MAKRSYIRRDKLVLELKMILVDLVEIEEHLPANDTTIALCFTLDRFKDIIAKLDGTYKSLADQITELASKHITDKTPDGKVNEYEFKPAVLEEDARIEIVVDKTKPSFRSPYKAVIWDILIRHGYTPAQLQDAEYHYPSSQGIE